MSDVDIKIRIEAAKAEAQLAKLNATLNITAEKEKQASLQTEILNKKLSNLDDAARNGGRGLTVGNVALASFVGNITSRAVSAGITSVINGFKGLLNAGIDFEAGLIQIAKTTGLGESATASFGKQIQKIASEIPVATNSLLEIATVAGQLGIKGEENLTAFTETMAKLSLASDIAGQEGAQSVARILTVTGELEKNGSQNIEKFGSVITRLGNNFAATENQILEVANQVAKGTTAFGVASEDVLALATAFKVTGSEAETSGTTIQKVFIKFSEAISEGGESLNNLAQITGLTQEQFSNLFKSDPVALFQKFAQGLNTAQQNGGDLIGTLKDLGLADQRVLKTLTPLITRYETLSTAISDARKEAKEKTALDEEAAKAAQSLQADLQQLSNSFNKLGQELFTAVGPALRSVVQTMTEFNTLLSDGTLNTAIVALVAGLGTTVIALAGYKISALGATAVTTALTVSFKAMWAAMLGPVGIAIALGTLAASMVIYSASTSEATEESDKLIKSLQGQANALDSAEGYKNATKETTLYLNGLSELTQVFGGIEAPIDGHKDALDGLIAPYGNLGKIAETAANQISLAASKTLLFELDKTKELKKFFKQEEIAKLESNFAIMKSEKDKEALESFVASEGNKRRSEALKSIIGLDKATLDAAKLQQEELKKLRQAQFDFENDLRKNELLAQEELRLQQEIDRTSSLGDNQIFQDARLTQYQEYLTQEQEATIQANINLAGSVVQREALIKQAEAEGIKARREAKFKELEELRKAQGDYDKERIQNQQRTLSVIGTLAQSKSKELAAIGKAAGVAQIAIDTPVAVASAYKFGVGLGGPPVGGIFAGLAATAMAAQAARIAGLNFEQGGIVPGTSFTGDKVAARVNSGEMILNRQQQNQLFAMANGQNQSPAGQQEIIIHTTVELDGEKVGASVSRQVANGLKLGEVQ